MVVQVVLNKHEIAQGPRRQPARHLQVLLRQSSQHALALRQAHLLYDVS